MPIMRLDTVIRLLRTGGAVLSCGLLLTATGCKKQSVELPVVAISPSECEDVEIYGEYVGLSLIHI